jgi:translation elongation factor EF-Tu-like GTPase
LFAYEAVEKPVGGGYIPSRLKKVLVPGKEEYEILADVLREEQAKNARDSNVDDEDLQSKTSKETYRAQRMRTIDKDDKKLCLYHAWADEKISAPSDASSDDMGKLEGLDQRAIGSEKNSNQLATHITEPPPMNGRDYISAAADTLAKENAARDASCRSIYSPVASAIHDNTGCSRFLSSTRHHLSRAAADESDDIAAAAAHTGARNSRIIRNAAAITHVDHGKSTSMEKALRERSVDLAGVERALDSNDMVPERCITIISKIAGVTYNEYSINIVDISGHGDFWAEKERVLSIVTSSILIVDATGGSMTLTKFVQSKALALYHHPFVLLNNVDRETDRPAEVEPEVFDLFSSFDAANEQLDVFTVSASVRDGWDSMDSQTGLQGVMPLLKKVIEFVPRPKVSRDEPFSIVVSLLSSDTNRCRVATGRVCSVAARISNTVQVVNRDDGRRSDAKISYIMVARGFSNTELQIAASGDIVSVSGVYYMCVCVW